MLSIGSKIRGYQLLYILGEGANAVVWCALHQVIKKKVSIKVISKTQRLDHAMNEIKILQDMNSKYVVELFEWFEDDDNLYIVMEYIPNGSLQNHVACMGSISEVVAKKYIYQLLLTMDLLHSKNIMHRDIKAENVLLDANNDIRLIDFGMSGEIENMKSICGSPAYMAPEMIDYGKYDKRADIWSIGVLLYYILVGEFPFYDDNIQKLFYKVIHTEFRYTISLSKEAQDLILRMLDKDPNTRISLAEALNHSWFICNEAFPSLNTHKSTGDVLIKKVRPLLEQSKKLQETVDAHQMDEVIVKILNNHHKVSSMKDLHLSNQMRTFNAFRKMPSKFTPQRRYSGKVKIMSPSTFNTSRVI